jgi:hypothetical protein
MKATLRLGASLVAGAVTLAPVATLHSRPQAASADFIQACAALTRTGKSGIEEASVKPAGRTGAADLPRHCEAFGRLDARIGIDRQRYAIRYHLRLPEQWNGRFFFQGGGGTNGNIGDAIGTVGGGAPNALAQGYAVVSQDSGHDNATNSDPARGGQTAFGADPIARANYGHASLKRVTDAAKAAIAAFYGRGIERSYFVGCSKGGQEGMAVAQRYPEAFDGIVATAPGFSLPKAALAQIWDVQTYGALVGGTRAGLDTRKLAGAFSPAQWAGVRNAVLKACDKLDGLEDGITGAFAQCTWRHVQPELNSAGLSTAQINALQRSFAGPRDGQGRALYSDWAWDAGIGSDGWRIWKLGNGPVPALNVATGGSALSMIFTTPPTPVAGDPASLAAYAMAFDFTHDAGRIFATSADFPLSAWEDQSARSQDLRAFRARGGKMIVPHGASDPVFSIKDTTAWYEEVQRRQRGTAGQFVRVFPVPGMAHCAGGPTTGGFNAFAALVNWVEHGHAPDRIVATAGADTPWPNRTRPLCPYPKIARYIGHGSIEDAANFACKAPSR